MKPSSSISKTARLSKESQEYLEQSASRPEDNDIDMISSTSDTIARSITSSSSFSLAREETRMVQRFKVLVVLVIVAVAMLIGVACLIMLKKQETANYHTQFEAIAQDLSKNAQVHIHEIFANLERFSSTLTGYAMVMNATWPFLTFPTFEVEAGLCNQGTKSDRTALYPLVYTNDLDAWTDFSVHNQHWIKDAHISNQLVNEDLRYENVSPVNGDGVAAITPYVWDFDNQSSRVAVSIAPFFSPEWQSAPAPDLTNMVNYDFRRSPHMKDTIDGMLHNNHAVFSRLAKADFLADLYQDSVDKGEPHVFVLQPVFNSFNVNRTAVAFISIVVNWNIFFKDVLASHERGITVIISNSCNESVTYVINGSSTDFHGYGHFHDEEFQELEMEFDFADWVNHEDNEDNHLCYYHAQILPTAQWKAQFFTYRPYVYTAAVVFCFILTTVVFVLYDVLVQRRQNLVMAKAKKTDALVRSLFPENVRDRLLNEVQDDVENGRPNWTAGSKTRCTSIQDALNSEHIFGSKAIADLFTDTTIMCADLVGFTAWASVRDPSMVFSLLETLFFGFDTIAKRRRVFKVESIGDAYVAAGGLPMPRVDHALVMCKFAHDCLQNQRDLVRRLETSLGPDTGNLRMRVGLHSGPVTAGVVRGEKGRFQLFGITLDTAFCMESSGAPNKIHVSEETAQLLVTGGREKWLYPRDDQVTVKGKGGMIKTFWVCIHPESVGRRSVGTNTSATSRGSIHLLKQDDPRSCGQQGAAFQALPSDKKRLVLWTVDTLLVILRQIMARRAATQAITTATGRSCNYENTNIINKTLDPTSNCTVLDEVQDVLALPQFDAKVFRNQVDPETIEVPSAVISQLTEFVAEIAASYNDNPFHNFDHAAHVTMSITKLLSRIVNPNEVSRQNSTDDEIAANLHDHTFGITSDPLTQFACIIAGLIHDADHPGVPNAILVKESHPLSIKYKNLSVAEQNSVDISWDKLLQYKDLQDCIYSTQEEHDRFRSILVNVVMATDICDKQLGAQRRARWERAFAEDDLELQEESHHPMKHNKKKQHREDVNRKATIVLEHLMQASDVAHTMQHWSVYKTWNEKLFGEMYKAFLEGRSSVDPSDGWYKGELGFFDFYIIPLSKKLEQCGVFGSSSSEYLHYATANRKEWEVKGEALVKEYLEKIHSKEQQEQQQQQEERQLQLHRDTTGSTGTSTSTSTNGSTTSTSSGSKTNGKRRASAKVL